jgi:hypothetical protein
LTLPSGCPTLVTNKFFADLSRTFQVSRNFITLFYEKKYMESNFDGSVTKSTNFGVITQQIDRDFLYQHHARVLSVRPNTVKFQVFGLVYTPLKRELSR